MICVSELSRLAVVLDAAPYATIPERLPPALARVLHLIGVEQPTVEQEIAAMGTIAIAKTSNRSVLGTVNEFVHYLRCMQTNRPVPPDLLPAVRGVRRVRLHAARGHVPQGCRAPPAFRITQAKRERERNSVFCRTSGIAPAMSRNPPGLDGRNSIKSTTRRTRSFRRNATFRFSHSDVTGIY